MSSDDILSKELEDFLDNTGIEAKPEPAPVPEPTPEPAAVAPEDPTAPVTAPIPAPTTDSKPESVHTIETTEPPVEPPIPVPAEPVSTGVEAPLTEREKLLMARLEEVTRQSLEAGTPATPVVQPVATPVVTPTPQPLNFIGDTKLDDILDSPEKFNAILVNVYNKGLEAARLGASEEIRGSVPKLVTSGVSQHSTMTSMVGDFYKENPDLTGVKRTVAAVANEVAAEDPNMAVDKVFEATAERTRRVLGLPAKVAGAPATPVVPSAPVVPAQPGSPAFVKQGSRKAASVGGLKGLAAEVNELVVDNY